MSAGTGIQHGEFNHSDMDDVHFLQIWITPKKDNIKPSYEQKTIPKIENEWVLIGSPDPENNAITIHQDIRLYIAHLNTSHSITYSLAHNRRAWIQVIKGEINLNTHVLAAGDGISAENSISFQCIENTEVLLFDLE